MHGAELRTSGAHVPSPAGHVRQWQTQARHVTNLLQRDASAAGRYNARQQGPAAAGRLDRWRADEMSSSSSSSSDHQQQCARSV